MLYNIVMKDLLKNLTQYANGVIDDAMVDKLATFFDMLTSTNEHTNLTRIVSPSDAVDKHFADSLSGIDHFPPCVKLLDVGSGGGFPALPIAITRPDLDVTMIDSTGKKVDFLNEVCTSLSLNARALHVRAEEYAHTSARESYDIVTARAVASLPTLLEYCLPFVKVGGSFVAYKTSEDELLDAQKALETLGGKLVSTHPYTLNGGDKRTLFIIKKVAPTPPKYPRGQGKPRNKPII